MTSRPAPRNARRRRTAGVALVELVLVLPILLAFSVVVVELGRGIYQYGLLTKSVRDAARYLSMHLPNTHITEARNIVVFGNPAGTGSPLAVGLTTSHVPAPTWSTTGSAPAITTVTVQVNGYAFQSLVPAAFGLPLGTINFGPVRASMRSFS